ncbi:MAG: ATP-dependent DNA helicase [Oscillospiraceae bacterium]|nr:ATP-dependent DNA helicase [Oscillospiraceae bacterium]
MFDFSNANGAQKEAISHTEGPLLITAGPGTGKTFTLVQRAVYLIQEKNVAPENIMIATFTEKAAKEIITRITNELMSRNISVNINEMYIGTFHSICLRFIKEHLEYTRVKKNYRLLDGFDQQYLIFQNIGRFRKIENIDTVLSSKGSWKMANEIAYIANVLNEELVDEEALCNDKVFELKIIGEILSTYNNLLSEKNMLDFSTIQKEAYTLLTESPDILTEIQAQIQYIMIDEYQDTNYIQEQIVFLLAGEKKNIAVVGDDDQGLYRFRGATIRNILEFPSKFESGRCKRVSLVINYRSDSKIVDFYNDWIQSTSGGKFKFEWDNFRYDKTIVPHKNSDLTSSSVVKVSSKDDEDEWYKQVLRFIHKLMDSGKVTNLNQIAFLFNSVKSERTVGLANYLESNGINIYSPRSNMFFQRKEVKQTFGFLLLAFPMFVKKLSSRNFSYVDEELFQYYEDCIKTAHTYIKTNKEESSELLRWIKCKGLELSQLTSNVDYAFSGMLYEMFEFSPFANILDTELTNGAIDLRPLRNLSMLTQIIAKYEYLHRVNIFTQKNIDETVEKFFNMYMRFLFNGGIGEYEDDSEYAPSGCVSFLTIHQSKGMEFPVTVVGSLGNVPRNHFNSVLDLVEPKYFHRGAFEPVDRIKFFDFWRLYYTAFSRAQNLLVLTCNEKEGQGCQPSKYFSDIYKRIPSFFDSSFNLDEFTFDNVKAVNIKEKYSFTSHISVYETCSLQYKFFKELGFTPIRVGATVFGTLVHQTIEDVHRSALRHEEHLITPENVKAWFDSNYYTISKSEHVYLAEPQLNAAYKQIMRYVERQNGDWSRVQETEVEVGLVKPNYILQGTIDLITGDNDTVEIVDFKSEKKPNLERDYDRVEHYKKQLQVYAHLVEEKTGKTVSKMHLYYTGAENEVPTITFKKNDESIAQTIQEFDDIVSKIQSKDFTHRATNQQTCDNCDFKHYCTNIRKDK